MSYQTIEAYLQTNQDDTLEILKEIAIQLNNILKNTFNQLVFFYGFDCNCVSFSAIGNDAYILGRVCVTAS